jgi:N-acetylmuramoyl-L-alanine amidase
LKDSGRIFVATAAAFRWQAVAAASVAALLLCAIPSQASSHRSQAWADAQFAKAEGQRETLHGRAEQARTRREYETVIASYRRVVLEAPTSSKAEGSAFLVAELTAEMGRHFKDQMALYAAVREYKYLRREYPGSKHRMEALLAIGEIYKNDLGDAGEARAAFQEFLRRYPHSELIKEARAELATTGEEPQAKDADDAGSGDEQARHQDGSDKSQTQVADNEDATTSKRGTGESKSSSDKPVKVKDVEYWSTPDYTRIAIDLEQDVQFKSQRISHPHRIYFDLKDAKVSSHLAGQSYDVDDGLVKKVRIAEYKPGLARVVIETENRAEYTASLLLNPPRLIIDVHAKDDSAPRKPVEAAKASDSDKKASDPIGGDDGGKPVVAVQKAAEPIKAASSGPKKVIVEADADDDNPGTDADNSPARPASSKARRSSPKTSVATAKALREAQPTAEGDRSLIRTLGLRIGKIVIDPGHGGHDTGTIGPHGLLEKDLVLDVSKRLGKLLQTRLGAEVVYTRHDDTFIPLETRTAIANQEEADLFVSVHANSSHDPDARGVETYYLNFTSSPEALEVAARENAASDKSIHELQDLVKKIALKEKIEESREFASDVQQSLHAGLAARNANERDRGVKKAPFIVLIGANMPSILAEISFVSNPTDERRLRTPAYRQRIAESLYRGIARYVNGLGGVSVASKVDKSSDN